MSSCEDNKSFFESAKDTLTELSEITKATILGKGVPLNPQPTVDKSRIHELGLSSEEEDVDDDQGRVSDAFENNVPRQPL